LSRLSHDRLNRIRGLRLPADTYRSSGRSRRLSSLPQAFYRFLPGRLPRRR